MRQTPALRSPPCGASVQGGPHGDIGSGGCAAFQPPFFLYLEQRGADFLISVKHSFRKGFQVIRDRLTYGRQAPFQASK